MPPVLGDDAWAIGEYMSNDPLVTQRELAARLGLTREQHLAAIAELRASPSAQAWIRNSGTGAKYWNNTIAPLLASGTLQAAIQRQWMYPNRVGLYTGISCMFYCGFCGRNPVARYDAAEAVTGRDVFQQIIDQDPKTDAVWQDRFRISGGLEPLTNPYLGDIIRYGTERGFRMQLYTNGNMMTAKYLDQHPGMLDLEAVRFSLYGTTADKAFAVTKNRHSFGNVIDNIVGFLSRGSSTKVGINWIVLPGHVHDVVELIDIVRDINERADRPVDFVTLREDFSQNIRVLSEEERRQFGNISRYVNMFQEQWPTHWDFGYALEPLRWGKDVGGLRMVDWDQIIPEGWPQVAVSVDVRGDVYMYHESGFLERPGADRYIMGNMRGSSVEQVTHDWVTSGRQVRPQPQDTGFLDAFDHVITLLIQQARDDEDFGIPWSQGPLEIRA
jgi:dTDP-4-amino-4,6-dideoxy-D-glucose ammonia-lyase